MLVQNITNNQQNPYFGIRINKNAAVTIIDHFKKFGATDDEIIYYLKDLRTSKPDRFELQNITIEPVLKNTLKGDKLTFTTRMWLSDSKKSGEFVTPRTYDFEDERFSPAEAKSFLIEHLLKAVNKATERMQHSTVSPSPLQKYKYILKKADLE
ncbi:hypothetical protein IKL64_01415 [bacterium]|nr:hypothetical protein [bacterium]